LRKLNTELAAGVRSNGWNGWGIPSRRVISELRFWWRNVYYNTPHSFDQRIPRALLMTDASEHGWGAILWFADTFSLTYGFFSTQDASPSSNRRETAAVLKALLYWRELLQQLRGQAISIRTDNMVIVFNLQRQGASESLLHETREIYSLLLKLDIRISVTHIPGANSTVPDALSRMDKVGDYSWKQEIFDQATRFLKTRPTVDLFANDHNHKCIRYLALPGPLGRNALERDALRFSWTGGNGLRVPSSSTDTEDTNKVMAGERQRADCDPGMAIEAVVEPVAGRGVNTGKVGAITNSPAAGSFDDGSGFRTPPRQFPHGQNFLQLIKDEKHRAGAELFLNICSLRKIREDFVVWQFQSISESSRRQRQHGWRL
jgi:ribonuclease HI